MIKNGETYRDNYSRAAAYFLGTLAPVPEDKKQAEAYEFIKGIYDVFYTQAESTGLKTSPDVHFAPWEGQKGREKDTVLIRGAVNKIEELIKELFYTVVNGTVTADGILVSDDFAPGRLLCKVLALSGHGYDKPVIRMSGDCALGLKEFCGISKDNIIHITDGPKEDKEYLYFSHCVFDPSLNWTARAFDALLDANGELISLCGELEKRGYTRVDCRDGKKVSLDYYKNHGKKNEPLKMAWAEREHTGIEVSFEELRLEPCFIWIRMPFFPKVLENIGDLPEKARDFILSHTKTCNGCRYCVNTDKTGTRPLAAVKTHDGKRKCPRFPGFSMNWRRLDGELKDNILSVIDALDATL